MQLYIDNIPVEAQAGESLLSMVRRLGLDTDSLATRPLAARMAGDTFTLSYVPLRAGYGEGLSRAGRRAVRAAKGQIALVRYDDERGQRVYERTLQFVFLLAVRNLFPDARVTNESHLIAILLFKHSRLLPSAYFLPALPSLCGTYSP